MKYPLLSLFLFFLLNISQVSAQQFQGFIGYSTDYQYAEGTMSDISLAGKVDSIASLEYEPLSGGALIDGVYYNIYVDESFYGVFGYVFYYLIAYDATTYREINRIYLDYSTYKYYCLAMTADPTGSRIFGQFENASGTQFEFATVEVSDGSRKTIGKCQNQYICMASADDGFVYGFAGDNNLYRINPKTGEETLVGATGLNAAHPDEGYYSQSMAFDRKKKVMYLAELDYDGLHSGIYSLNLATAAPALVSTASEGSVLQIEGLVVANPKAEDDAPDAITDLSVHFDGPSLTAAVSFTIPSVTFAGDRLDGDIEYFIVANDDTVGRGHSLAGTHVTEQVNVSEGIVKFFVLTRNRAGESPKARTTAYAGYDTPSAPSDVNLKIAADGQMTLTWKAPSSTLNHGYLGSLTYNIYKDDQIIAEGITDTLYQTQLSLDTYANYIFAVKAVNTSRMSEAAYSNAVKAGTAVQVPVTWGSLATGISETDYALFTVEDTNNDGCTWGYQSGILYNFSSTNKADDWIFTPKIKVKRGKAYEISYIAATQSDNYPELLEVKLGNNASSSSMITTLKSTYAPTTDASIVKARYTSLRDAEVVIGFHALSPANSYYIHLPMVSVEKVPESGAPAASTKLDITPLAPGSLQATVAFTAPDKAISGSTLSSLSEIRVFRNDRLIKTFASPRPGDRLSFDDTVDQSNLYTYLVVAYNECENGEKATATSFLGHDIPVEVTDARLTDQTTTIKVDWTPVKSIGTYGGYVNPDSVTYEIYALSGDYVKEQLASVHGSTATVCVNPDEGEMQLTQFAIRPVGIGGTGAFSTTGTLLTGTPYTLPLFETFTSADVTNFWWLSSKGSSSWSTSLVDSYDEGGKGCAYFKAQAAGDQAWINTGKINVRGTVRPEVIFAARIPQGAKLIVEATRRDETGLVLGTFEGTSATSEWTIFSASIPNSCKTEDFIVVKFHAYAPTKGQEIFLDDIQIRDVVNSDLAISITSTPEVRKGQDITVLATISNQGSRSAVNYTIKVENQVLTETEALPAYSKRDYTFTLPTTMFTPGDTMEICAEVIYSSDENPINDEATSHTRLRSSIATPVSDLAAEKNGNDVILTWNAVEDSATPEYEDFESYANLTAFPYTKNPSQQLYFSQWNKEGALGPWTAYDLDGGAIYGWYNEDIPWPYNGDAMAFSVFNYEKLFYSFEHPDSLVHTGHQALMCMNMAPTDGGPAHNDDWLISPELSGRSQTLSFWVGELSDEYGHETFEVLTSTTDIYPESFVKIGEGTAEKAKGFINFTYQLPEGTKYFAIRVTTTDNFAFLLDDITYESGTTAPSSFNIYKNEKFVMNTTSRTYTDAGMTDEGARYSVTAVYPNGTVSVPVTIGYGTASGINDAKSSPAYAKVIDLRGISLQSTTALKPGTIYILGGKKRISPFK